MCKRIGRFLAKYMLCPTSPLRYWPVTAAIMVLMSGPSGPARIESALAAQSYPLDYIGKTELYQAAYEDTLIHLARNNGLGFVEVRAANPGLDPWIPGEGKEIVLPKQHLLPDAPREGIVINLPEMRIYAYLTPGQAPLTYPIGIGREGLSTPTGTTKIIGKIEGPTWRPTPRMRKEDPELPREVAPGPENPLGTHALYLGWKEYAIHGTNRPFGIGRRISSGCIRMYPEDIEEFYSLVPVSTPVTIVDQTVKAGWIDDILYVEAHPPQERLFALEKEDVRDAESVREEDIAYVLEKAGEYSPQIDRGVLRQALKQQRGYPVPVFDKAAAAAAQKEAQAQEKAQIESETSINAESGSEAEKAQLLENSELEQSVQKQEQVEPQEKDGSAAPEEDRIKAEEQAKSEVKLQEEEALKDAATTTKVTAIKQTVYRNSYNN